VASIYIDDKSYDIDGILHADHMIHTYESIF